MEANNILIISKHARRTRGAVNGVTVSRYGTPLPALTFHTIIVLDEPVTSQEEVYFSGMRTSLVPGGKIISVFEQEEDPLHAA